MPANGKSKQLPPLVSAHSVSPLLCTILCMTIYVNNKACELPAASAITGALQLLNIPPQNGMALAVNSNVIPRLEWNTHTLNENDKLIIIKATQGG